MITLGTLTLTDEDLAVIGHVVHNETPEEWATRAFNYPKGGEAAVLGKIARYRASYLAGKDVLGYKTASEKMTDRRNAEDVVDAQALAAAQVRETAAEAALDARIAAEVAKQLADRP